MKVKIGDYVIEVKARKNYEKTINEKATKAFLTHIECALWDASHHAESEGLVYTAMGYRDDALCIDAFLTKKEKATAKENRK